MWYQRNCFGNHNYIILTIEWISCLQKQLIFLLLNDSISKVPISHWYLYWYPIKSINKIQISFLKLPSSLSKHQELLLIRGLNPGIKFYLPRWFPWWCCTYANLCCTYVNIRPLSNLFHNYKKFPFFLEWESHLNAALLLNYKNRGG